tara:strand:- start:6693 stop:7607 length:915 start_codon:yes stop_codon:yes gene_type:complete
MAMRSQVYEWTNLAPTGSTSTLFRRSTDVPVALASGTQISVFIGGTGYNITKPAETTATQFVVIEDVALTPDGSLTQTGGLALGSILSSITTNSGDATINAGLSPVPNGGTITSSGSGTGASISLGNTAGVIDTADVGVGGSGFAAGDTITFGTAAIGGTTPVVITLTADDICVAQNGGHAQIRINTTNYFQNPDVTQQSGIPGLASPYPRGVNNILKTFDLYPDIYVLPGQVWDVQYTQGAFSLQAGEVCDVVAVFIKYTLYDGPDALIANKLLELGITVNPNNVDWYKRTLIEQQSASMGGV